MLSWVEQEKSCIASGPGPIPRTTGADLPEKNAKTDLQQIKK